MRFAEDGYEQPATQWIERISTTLTERINKLTRDQISTNPVAGTVDRTLSDVSLPYDKDNPFKATIATIQKITGRGSPKDTYHVEIDISDSGIRYEPGDALGIIAHNQPDLVD